MKLEGFTQRSSNLTGCGDEELPPRDLSTTLCVPACVCTALLYMRVRVHTELARAQLVHEQLVYGLVS